MRKQFLILGVIALMAGSGGYFVAMVTDPAQTPPPPAATELSGPAIEDLVGQRRPDFTLQDPLGVPVSASEFDGHIWLVNFWATWCAPCVDEMPMLSQLQQAFADQGVKIVGIALDEPERAREFAEGLGISYPILVGQTDVVITGRQYGNTTGMLPFSVLIDANGIIRWARIGVLKRDELEAHFRALLGS